MPKGNRGEISRLSDVAAVVGGALVLALIGYLAWDAARPSSPPAITATVVQFEVRPEGEAVYVPVDVRNVGDRPATAVVLQVSGAEGEAASTVIDYLAGGERARVVVLVEGGAASPAFRVRVRSYQEP
ncbi:MAG TPA: hypothetical protein VM778_13230 [Gemmatimonadota bacterium]|nr:hypothetical protein [Gemmatimonadota bacterium]